MEIKGPKVLIIGAGITGLSLAHGLTKAGIPFEIFEKYGPEGRARDWGVTVHWAIEFLSLYPDGMEDRLRAAQVVVNRDPQQQEQVLFHDGATGKQIKIIPLGTARRYSQRKIRQALVNGLEDVIQYHKALQTVTEIQDGVRVTFADGTTADGSIVVGCDGSQSDARQLLFKNINYAKWKPLPGFMLNNFWMQYTREQALEVKAQLSHFMDIAVHPNGTYYGLIPLDISDMERPESWKFQIFMAFPTDIPPEEDSSEKRFQLVKAAGKTFVDPFRLGVEYMPDDTYISLDRYGTWESKKWDHKRGRVVLAGDAAHAMTARKFTDVLNLIAGLKLVRDEKTTLHDFVESYVDEVVDRGANEVRMSLAQGLAVHNWANSKDMPILQVGTTPLHMEQSVVPLPSSSHM